VRHRLDLPISFCRHRSVPVPRDPLAIAKSLLHGVVHFPLQPSPLSANLQCKAIPLTCPELTAVVRLGSEVRASDSFQIFALTAEEFLGGRDMTGGICLRGGITGIHFWPSFTPRHCHDHMHTSTQSAVCNPSRVQMIVSLSAML